MYRELLESLIAKEYTFITFAQYIRFKVENTLPERFIILRHDVDDLVQNSMDFANIQAEMSVNGTFYFRMVPQSFDDDIIKAMLKQGH
jgi:alpha-acetolactate decarboxylase